MPILPPDINASDLAFTVTPGRRPLRPRRGEERRRGAIAVDPAASRGRTARIASLYRLCEDVDLRLVNKRVLESLIKGGALDSLVAGDAGAGRGAGASSGRG